MAGTKSPAYRLWRALPASWRARALEARLRYANSGAVRGALAAVRMTRTMDFGDLRRTEPHSRFFGLDRGTPVDRHYIERFLDAHRGDVRGAVLEFGEDTYARRFGGPRVSHVDVLHPDARHPRATITADIVDAPSIPDDRFDCVICTQVLQYVPDLAAAFATLHRILAPGGVLLASAPGISQLSRQDADAFGEYWRLTTYSARRLAEDAFGGAVLAQAQGKVLASIAFLAGIPVEELAPRERDAHDPDYELVVLLRAVKRP